MVDKSEAKAASRRLRKRALRQREIGEQVDVPLEGDVVRDQHEGFVAAQGNRHQGQSRRDDEEHQEPAVADKDSSAGRTEKKRTHHRSFPKIRSRPAILS